MRSSPSPLPPDVGEPLARCADRLGPFARAILWYPEVASTNDLAAALAERGVEEGCIVMADAQSAGRGRYGRTWVSPPGAGLYVSIVLTPPPHTVPLLTIAAGVAVAEGIRAATGLDSHLKWPNDVYLGERKVAGVLAEAAPATATASVQYVILGIGINVAPAAYPPEIASRATSLEVELGRAVDRGLLLAECLCALAARYADLQGGREGMVIGGWRRRAAPSLGRAVRWEAADGVRVGVAEDIDARGALIVRTDTGRERIIAGEVQWV